MNSFEDSITRKARRQKLGMILIPPITVTICLLVGFDLISTTMITLATVFPASLYSRRLTVCAEKSPSYGQEEDAVEIFKDKKNMVVYKTPEGFQVIGFYKILRRPQGYVFHTLRVKFSKSNLTIYPMIHVNGPFLAIHFCDNGYRNQQYLIWEAPQHLDTFAQTLMQNLPSLALEPASFTDTKSLMRVFGLKLSETTREDSQAMKKPDHRNQEQEGRTTQDQLPAKENLRKHLQQSEGIIPGNEKSINSILRNSLSSFEPSGREFTARKHGYTVIKEPTVSSPESKLHFLNTNAVPAMSDKETLATLTDAYQKILMTIESVRGGPNAVPVTPTAKRIAARLIVKDLTEMLEVFQTLPELSPEIHTLVNAFEAYFEHYLGDLLAKRVPVKTETLWEHIPGAVVVVGMILEKLAANQSASNNGRNSATESTGRILGG